MSRLMSMVAVVVSGAVVVGCSHGGTRAVPEPRSSSTQTSKATPCNGRGEHFFQGIVTNQSLLPPGATVTRQVRQRDWVGYCYTTPESLERAAKS